LSVVISICPRCGQTKLHHSRARGAFERFRKRFTDRVPFRCHGCGWRGWLHDIVAEPPPREVLQSLTEADYDRIDSHRKDDQRDGSGTSESRRTDQPS
jgi:NADH:ubiquinone oxidoreductase subunit